MKHWRRSLLPTLVLASAAACAIPDAAAAQGDGQERWHPQWGDWSLSFALPAGGAAGIGFWRQWGESLALGLTLDGDYERLRQDTPTGVVERSTVGFAVGPALRRYWWADGPVSPFLYAGLSADYRTTTEDGRGSWVIGGGFDLGIGAEWFPAEGFGIGGFTGLSGAYGWISDQDGVDDDLRRLALDLFTSRLAVSLYF